MPVAWCTIAWSTWHPQTLAIRQRHGATPSEVVGRQTNRHGSSHPSSLRAQCRVRRAWPASVVAQRNTMPVVTMRMPGCSLAAVSRRPIGTSSSKGAFRGVCRHPPVRWDEPKSRSQREASVPLARSPKRDLLPQLLKRWRNVQLRRATRIPRLRRSTGTMPCRIRRSDHRSLLRS